MKKILLLLTTLILFTFSSCEKENDNVYYQVANNNAIIMTMSGYGNVNIKNYSNSQISFDNMAKWFKEAFNQCIRNSFEVSCGTLSATYYNLNNYDISDSSEIIVSFYTTGGLRCEARIYRQSGKYRLINHSFRNVAF